MFHGHVDNYQDTIYYEHSFYLTWHVSYHIFQILMNVWMLHCVEVCVTTLWDPISVNVVQVMNWPVINIHAKVRVTFAYWEVIHQVFLNTYMYLVLNLCILASSYTNLITLYHTYCVKNMNKGFAKNMAGPS